MSRIDFETFQTIIKNLDSGSNYCDFKFGRFNVSKTTILTVLLTLNLNFGKFVSFGIRINQPKSNFRA